MSVPAANLPLLGISWLVWKFVPGRAATKMAEFSHTEAGSGLDMLAAAAESPRRELRARYFRHALDELRHSRLFRERAVAMAAARSPGGHSRAQAVLDDGGYIASQGIRGNESLFRQLGELEFLAFVWVHEKRGAEQFDIYADLLRDDAPTASMFAEIARDERFHIAYSRAELDRYVKGGGRSAVRWAVLRVRGRRAWQGWLRFTRELGNRMAGLWLGILYLFLIGPCSLVARATERPVEGIVPVASRPAARERARAMA